MNRMIQVFIVPFAFMLLLVPLAFAKAQVISTPYFCGSYWSSTPCNYGFGGGYYPYPQYPYNYQPYYYNYPYNYVRPTCTITYSYGSYYKQGYANQAIVLSWYSNGATSASLSGSGAVTPTGSTTVYPSGSTTYTLTVWGPGGSGTCQTTVYQPTYYYQPYTYYQQYPYMYYPYQYNYNPYWGY